MIPMGEARAMSAPHGSEDITDNFRELIRDRITRLTEELNDDELMQVWAFARRLADDFA